MSGNPENGNKSENARDGALALRIEAIRRAKGLTLDELAARAGVSRATLSRIERGETSPTAQVLGRLCAAFGMTMSQLLLAVEEDAPRLIRFSEAFTWRDPETGFQRRSLSPPAQGYDTEVIWGELPAGAVISYDASPVAGLEHHIVLMEGQLNFTLSAQEYELRPGDCLRFKLYGASRFANPMRSGLALYLVIIRRPT